MAFPFIVAIRKGTKRVALIEGLYCILKVEALEKIRTNVLTEILNTKEFITFK